MSEGARQNRVMKCNFYVAVLYDLRLLSLSHVVVLQ